MLLHKKNRLIPKRRSRLPWLFLVLLLGLCGLAVVKLNSINSEAHVNSNSDVPEFDFFRPTDESPSQPEELPEPEPPTVEDLIGPFPIDISEAEYDEGSDSLLYLAANGNIARLTINHQLQSHLSRVMARYDEPAQALVALDPATGRVLAWVGDRNSS